MCPTFVTPGDALPPGRRKVIHSVGVVGRVEWRDVGGGTPTQASSRELLPQGSFLETGIVS